MATGGAIILTRGDDYSQTLTLTADDGGPYDLTACTLWFTMKARISDADDDAVVQHQSGDGNLTITDAAGGEASHVIPASETDGLALDLYVYDYQIIAADGTVATVERGKLLVRADVTRSVA